MKKLLFYFLLLFIAVYLGGKFAGNPGYVLFAYHDWSIEVSLWFATLLVLLFVFILCLLLQAYQGIHAIVNNCRMWLLRRKIATWCLMHQGFCALIEENFIPLSALLPQLRKKRILTVEQFDTLEFTVYRSLFLQACEMGALSEVSQLWNSLPRRLRKQASFLSDYCECLIKYAQDDEAEVLLQSALKKQWDPRLIRHYGRVKSRKPLKQLAFAKTWLKSHGNDPDLLLCLAWLSMGYSLWGQARDYLQASIRAGGGIDVYSELAKVLEELGEQSAALNCYRELATKCLS